MKKRIIKIITYLVWLFVTYYAMLPPLNAHSLGFWAYLAIVIILPPALNFLFIESDVKVTKKGVKIEQTNWNRMAKLLFGAIGVIILVVLIGAISGAKLFHARGYANILKPEERDFSEDIDQKSALSMIALMDTNSAIRLGNREIGSLTELVSQYNVSDFYSQINYKNAPLKVSALEYAGFFKWCGNHSEGAPGYVKVDPVEQKANYVTLEKGMRYIPSAYFNENLERVIRFHYPTAIFGNVHFEIDEEGNPYYVASVYTYKLGLFGGKTVKGAIICDPTNGDCTYYDVEKIPEWVDDVYDGELLTKQYNWHGELSNGFWNSVFGKKGCKKCTSTRGSEDDGYVADYGYIAKDGDIWIYTGVTSVNDDASNIGFILVNERTAEAHSYVIAGADENSAMSAAEGEVQEKRYQASFPSLINVYDNPTYVMVLKDASGIVKLYAMVNVEQYNMVTTATTLDECFAKYKRLVKTGIDEDDADSNDEKKEDSKKAEEKLSDPQEFEAKIASIQYVTISGETYVYLETEDGKILRQQFAENESIITLRTGDIITVKARENAEGTYYIQTFSKK